MIQEPNAPAAPAGGAPGQGEGDEGGGDNKFIALVGGIHTALSKVEEVLDGKVAPELVQELQALKEGYKGWVMKVNEAFQGGGGQPQPGGAPQERGAPVSMEGGPSGVPMRQGQ